MYNKLIDKFITKFKSYTNFREKREMMKNYSLKNITDIPLNVLNLFPTIKAFNPRFEILVDVGSHKGMFAKGANAFFDIKKTFCIEPNPHLIDEIIRNNPCVIVKNLALSDNDGEANYFLHEDAMMNSIIDADPQILLEKFPCDNPESIILRRVKTNTLDQFVENECLSNDNSFMIKLDTQGNELNILKGGIKTLRKTNVCIIEYMFLNPYKNDYNFMDLVSFMYEVGFDCKGPLRIEKRPSHEVSGVYFLFVRKFL